MSTPAERIVAVLASNGRTVQLDVIQNELDGLEGLSAQDAEITLLACYGITGEEPERTFVRDHTSRTVVAAVLREIRPAFLYTLATGTLLLVPTVCVPFAMRFFVDRYIVAGKQEVGIYVAAGLLVAAILTAVLVVMQYEVIRRSYLRMSGLGQTSFVWHVLRMRPDELAARSPGEIIARMNARQVMAVQGGQMIPLAAVNVINAVAFALALWALDTSMFVATMAVTLLTAFVCLRVLSSRVIRQKQTDAAMTGLTATVTETLSSMESIKAAAWEQAAFEKWAVRRADMAATQSNLAVSNQWLTFIPAIGLALGLGVVLAIGTYQVIRGQLSLGTLVAAQSFVAMLLGAVGLVIYMGALIQATTSAGQQSNDVLGAVRDPESLEPRNPAPIATLRGEVGLRGLTFGYSHDHEPLIKDLDLTIPAGHRVALVGPSGSGKTTIARLVTGELRPWRGTVRFDDIPRLRIPRQIRANGIAYVPQQPVLFTGTIHDNLTVWNPDIPDADVRRAARDACIEHTILSRPGGYYARVSGDAGFSGGERQRLAIARALAGNPQVLILDEATSALDPVVELQVEENVRRRGITCLVVAHRLSTVRDADEILVVDGGRVVQRGRFEDLLHEGLFSELIHG